MVKQRQGEKLKTWTSFRHHKQILDLSLKSINLLSGGEKTLTAIALLFAILNIRYVPFCILDEVEAALDEANVDAFGSYLLSRKERSQFIIITHKKRTMEYADALYGITMQESGVSKLVSVKLEN